LIASPERGVPRLRVGLGLDHARPPLAVHVVVNHAPALRHGDLAQLVDARLADAELPSRRHSLTALAAATCGGDSARVAVLT